ncbi:hypothetical protein B0H14DRAFT_2646052 [Mycena olivaceomarginata]|nr:hypothetical protein B0H14DRAFT_2646052 [Mycena olivaceomarginata]
MAIFSFLRAVVLALISSRLAFGSTAQGLDALEECPDTESSVYDYIVVGSGAGGGPVAARLSENGFSVLVVETGLDQSNNINTTLASLAFAAIDGTLEHQQSEAIHNGIENNIGGLYQTLDTLARTFNDSTWTRDNMQSFYALIERNLYLTPPNPDHGFDGWLSTIRVPVNFSSTDPQWEAVGTAVINASGPVIEDINSHLPLPHFGRGLSSSTSDTTGHRSSIRDRLDVVAANSTDKLTIMTNTLATKVLLCRSGGDVVAYGLSVAPGAKLPIAQGSSGKQDLNETRIVAKREVIISAGVFQSPQLLMVFYDLVLDSFELSGIGDSAQLDKFDIPSIVHLPGVGSNLQDNDEVPALWELKQNSTDPVGFGEVFSTSAQSATTEPDILAYFVPADFHGFVHDTPNFFTIVNLKALSSSKGYVRLTGSHPQDLLDINKLRFQAPGGQQDIVALREGVKRWREVMKTPEVKQYVEKEVNPGANVTTDEDLDNYVLESVFGHHACCTNAIGPDDDPQAVLDGDFNVRGVKNLRVVDASSWPEIPGYFPTTPTYMIAEKAAQVILRDARQSL